MYWNLPLFSISEPAIQDESVTPTILPIPRSSAVTTTPQTRIVSTTTTSNIDEFDGYLDSDDNSDTEDKSPIPVTEIDFRVQSNGTTTVASSTSSPTTTDTQPISSTTTANSDEHIWAFLSRWQSLTISKTKRAKRSTGLPSSEEATLEDENYDGKSADMEITL